jgi:hypothetical protein
VSDHTVTTWDRPRGLFILDLLESYAREREIEVYLERRGKPPEWSCLLSEGRTAHRGSGPTARAAIRRALDEAGVDLSGTELT